MKIVYRIVVSVALLMMFCARVQAIENSAMVLAGENEEKQVAKVLETYFRVDGKIVPTGYAGVDNYVSKLLFDEESESFAQSFETFKKLWNIQPVKDYESRGLGQLPVLLLKIQKEGGAEERFVSYRLRAQLYANPQILDSLRHSQANQLLISQYERLSAGVDHGFVYDIKDNRVLGLSHIFKPDVLAQLKRYFGAKMSVTADKRELKVLSANGEGRFAFNQETESNFREYFKQLVGWDELVSKEDPTKKVFDAVDKMPEFPGGLQALLKWIGEHLKYPVEAQEKEIQGKVVCSFIVEPDGSTTSYSIVRGVHPLLEKEAIRLLKQMPRWIPGEFHGEKVRVKYNLPLTFRLP